MAVLVLAMFGVGALAGFSAGLFGIGGGAIIVPALYYSFGLLGVPAEITMHMAVATSASVIIISSIRSGFGHYKKGAVDLDMIWPKHNGRRDIIGFLQGWAFWIGIGSLLAALVLARYVSGQILVLIFGLIASLIALQLIFGRPDWRLADKVPKAVKAAPIALGFGSLCSLMGIGFGSFGVTFMLLFGQKIHRAIGTAALLGLSIGLPASIGYIISGQGVEGRPPLSLGYINLLGFALIGLASVLFVPLGVRAAHALPQKNLRRLFGICLLAVALNMLGKAV